jgi:alpha-beta hydrolase superfamily lysophospholipase
MNRHAFRRAALLLPLALAACAPRLQEIGPPVDAPRLEAAFIHMPDGVDLPLRQWQPWDRPTEAAILGLHGFNDYSKGLAAVGKGMARRGFAFYAYDQRGFGATPQRGIWPGEAQLVADLRVAAKLVKAQHPGLPLFLLGESMGGSVIMAAMTGDDPPIADGVILAAPAIWGFQTMPAFQRKAIEVSANLVPWMKVVPTGVHVQASDNRAALRDLARDPLVIKETRVDTAYGLVQLMSTAFDAAAKLDRPRWLVMFGEREAILSRGAVNQALPRFPGLAPDQGRLAIYRRGYHLLLRDFGQYEVFDDIAAWIRDPKAPLPSGADRNAAKESIN